MTARFLTADDIAEELQVSRSRAYEIAHEIPHLVVGRSIRVSRKAFDAYVRRPARTIVTVDDVVASMGVKKTVAYQHLRAAAGRDAGQRGPLRVPLETWQHYRETGNGEPAGADTWPTWAGVYFVRADHLIKIGSAFNIKHRLQGLQSGSPHDYELLLAIPAADNPRAAELQMHARFATDRVRGEWFGASRELLQFIAGERERLAFDGAR